jgi:hypothetical protein
MKISVANLYKRCSLNGCGMIASTAVRMFDGSLYYRCGAHEGIVSATFGEVVHEVDDDNPITGSLPRYH